MHLKQNMDCSLRFLLYSVRTCARTVSSREIRKACVLSCSHSVNIVNKLVKCGRLTLKRGRFGGGIKPAAEPEGINLSTVLNKLITPVSLSPSPAIAACFALSPGKPVLQAFARTA